MKRIFKAKKKVKFNITKYVFIFLIVLSDYLFFINIINNKIKFQLYHNESLLTLLGIHITKEEKEIIKPIMYEIPKIENLEVEIKKPKIYLYNSHQGEEYKDTNVMEMSSYFKDSLEANGINAIHEEYDVIKRVKEDKLDYKGCYKITRELITNVMSDDISFYLDIHRDSGSKKVTTATINNKSYAKVMFLIGAKHDTYKQNESIANELNKILKDIAPGLSRGIYKRESSSYNQDLGSNIFILEVGGPENTKEELQNTMDILSKVFKEYMEI